MNLLVTDEKTYTLKLDKKLKIKPHPGTGNSQTTLAAVLEAAIIEQLRNHRGTIPAGNYALNVLAVLQTLDNDPKVPVKLRLIEVQNDNEDAEGKAA